jgi:hypothetical protein
MTRGTRGLFRLWLVLSAMWVGFWGWPLLYMMNEWARPERHDAIIATLLIPPLIVLAIGAALVWAFRGFRA